MNRTAQIAQMKAAAAVHLDAGRALAIKAQQEGRNFTPAELEAVADHLDQAKKLKAKYGDLELIAPLDALGGATSGGSTHGAKGWSAGMTVHLDRIGAKALTTTGTITVPSLSAGIITSTDRPRSVLNLIPFVPLTDTDQFSYIKETARTHNASTVARGKKKPESAYTMEKVTDRVRTIAHLTTVDRDLVMDVRLLQQYLEGSLSDGVELELEDQVINAEGSTTGVLDDMTGVLDTSGTQSQAFVDDRLRTARKAVTKLENLNLDPSGFAWLMSPSEWEAFELLSDANDRFLLNDGTAGTALPLDRANRRLWGYPVATSTVMGAESAILGDWGGSAEIHEREGVTVEWAQTGYMTDLFGAGQHGDLWEANKVRFRAEGRWGFAVKRPLAFVITELVDGE